MQKFKLLNLALACALLFNFTAALHAQEAARPAGAATATAPATTGALSAAALEAANTITAARLSEHLHIVASDAMGGRDTPSKGLDDTAKYIADHLKRFGLKPAGDDGSYFQNFTLIRRKVDPAKTTAMLDNRAFKFGEDFLASPATGKASGALVFASHGWVLKSKNIDAYKGIDVRDKIVIVAAGLPAGITRGDIKGKPGEDWEDPQSYALRNGAKGLILIPRTPNIERWWRAVRAGGERGSVEMERFANPEGSPQPLPSIFASAAMIDAIFQGETVSGADIFKATQAGESRAAFALSPKKRMTFDAVAAIDKQTTQNVIAMIEGNDATLKQEYVAVGAHYDHVGTGLPDASGDALYNGADDDGSGTVAILAMAEALSRAKARPARSILFVWHAGEEKGLWGSQYFTKYPTVPIKQIVAQLNMDMIGRSKKEGDTKPENKDLSGPNEIYVIGSKMMSTELGDLSERINRAYLNLTFNYKYDDPADPNRFFFRSDHFNYAQRGIPIIFYFDGVHEDYHRPSDTPDKIDYQKMEKITRTVLVTALELANAPARPRVDKQLPPELMTR
ncbi:MAG TPA: M20/M25/M40 family metallo-hydrolase [Pyrinomonadaceae bacterium]|nr:M20/M25/M40 family metallo-hydrolase [Pyrinomonadaceae bacterium]